MEDGRCFNFNGICSFISIHFNQYHHFVAAALCFVCFSFRVNCTIKMSSHNSPTTSICYSLVSIARNVWIATNYYGMTIKINFSKYMVQQQNISILLHYFTLSLSLPLYRFDVGSLQHAFWNRDTKVSLFTSQKKFYFIYEKRKNGKRYQHYHHHHLHFHFHRINQHHYHHLQQWLLLLLPAA